MPFKQKKINSLKEKRSVNLREVNERNFMLSLIINPIYADDIIYDTRLPTMLNEYSEYVVSIYVYTQ